MKGNEKFFEKLSFSGSIKGIGDGAFDAFTKLKTLIISKAEIQNISSSVLTSKLGSTLRELDLSFNLISRLSSNTFKHLANLLTLNLSFNMNLNLSIPIFSSALSNLKSLNLEECGLTNLTNTIFSNLT